MDSIKDYILLFVGFLVLSTLFAFTNNRNGNRVPVTNQIAFTTKNNLFIDEEVVNKLLIQNKGSHSTTTKETLVLDSVEAQINKIPYVKDSQVFMSIGGSVNVDITPRKVIARVYSSTPHYLDEEGVKIPISTRHSERVPMVYNYYPAANEGVVTILKKMEKDSFYKKRVVGIYCKRDNQFEFKIREFDGKVSIGNLSDMDTKLINFKVFYAKAVKDQILDKYKKINLQIANQVVCTK